VLGRRLQRSDHCQHHVAVRRRLNAPVHATQVGAVRASAAARHGGKSAGPRALEAGCAAPNGTCRRRASAPLSGTSAPPAAAGQAHLRMRHTVHARAGAAARHGGKTTGVDSVGINRRGVVNVRVRVQQKLACSVGENPVWSKYSKCVDGSRSSMMDVEDEHNHMRAAFGLCDRFGQPGTPAAE
jgi:hypothetical protein